MINWHHELLSYPSFSGVHHKKQDCEASTVVKKAREILKKAAKYLYPKEIVVNKIPPRRKTKVPKGNGGWGDHRDQTLCMNMAMPLRTQSDILAALEVAQNKT